MEEFDFPQSLIDRVNSLRGRLHPFDGLDPLRTALVVIDMQNVFVEERAAYEVPASRRIVPNINRLAGATRENGGLVAWVQMTCDTRDRWPTFFDNMFAAGRADCQGCDMRFDLMLVAPWRLPRHIIGGWWAT